MNIPEATDALRAQGVGIFNPYLYGSSDEDEAGHVDFLLRLINPRHGAVVVDAGSGIGAVASMMSRLRPDLHFVLINTSAYQNELAEAGVNIETRTEDFHAMSMPDGGADALMFNASFGHSQDPMRALVEAARVLNDGGVLLINDMQRVSGDNGALFSALNYLAWPAEDIASMARAAGFEFVGDASCGAHARVGRFMNVLNQDGIGHAMDGVEPYVGVFIRRRHAGLVESAMWRHQRIGFQFSGGRDSLAALFLLRPYWDRMTVYHTDTGDLFPETMDVVSRVEAVVPRFVRIAGRLYQTQQDHGMPSDVVPTSCTPVGRLVSGQKIKVIDRYDCCYRSLMQPMQERMKADGITLIVRGQRDSDYDTPPMKSGQWSGLMEVLYPIEKWTSEQVMLYLQSVGQEPPPFYERGMKSAPECMTCTAWLNEGRAAYLRDYHPGKLLEYQKKLARIRLAINEHLTEMDAELECTGDEHGD